MEEEDHSSGQGAQRVGREPYLGGQTAGRRAHLTLRIEELLEQGDAAASNFEQLLAQVTSESPPHLQGDGEEEPETPAAGADEPVEDEPTAGRGKE